MGNNKSKIVDNSLRDKIKRGAEGAEVISNTINTISTPTQEAQNNKFVDVPDDELIEYIKPLKKRKTYTIAFTVKEYNSLVISAAQDKTNLVTLIKNALIATGKMVKED